MNEQQKIDHGLKQAGFGGLKDPRLFEQIATVISGRSEKEMHFRFRSLLLSAEPAQRKMAYDSIAPKLRWKALPLEDYLVQGAQEAEKKQLPHYNPATMTITEWAAQDIQTEEHKHQAPEPAVDTLGRPALALEERASKAIAKDLREHDAKGQLVLVCRKCTREQTFRGKRRDHMLKLARQEGWMITPAENLCIFCKPKVQ